MILVAQGSDDQHRLAGVVEHRCAEGVHARHGAADGTRQAVGRDLGACGLQAGLELGVRRRGLAAHLAQGGAQEALYRNALGDEMVASIITIVTPALRNASANQRLRLCVEGGAVAGVLVAVMTILGSRVLRRCPEHTDTLSVKARCGVRPGVADDHRHPRRGIDAARLTHELVRHRAGFGFSQVDLQQFLGAAVGDHQFVVIVDGQHRLAQS